MDIKEFTMEQLLDGYLKAVHLLEETDASISVLREEMKNRLDAENVKGKIVGDHSIAKVTRTTFKPTLEQARELAAVKTVESVDTAALKRLYDQGVEIPNTLTTSFVMVRPVDQEK